MTKILIVDDSKVVRKFISKCLEDIGILDFKEATDGVSALDIVKEQMPESILLDWNMPEMDGIEFLSHLRELPQGDNVKVIFCTTENEISKIQEALSNSANEYIMKPFDREILENKLTQLGIC